MRVLVALLAIALLGVVTPDPIRASEIQPVAPITTASGVSADYGGYVESSALPSIPRIIPTSPDSGIVAHTANATRPATATQRGTIDNCGSCLYGARTHIVQYALSGRIATTNATANYRTDSRTGVSNTANETMAYAGFEFIGPANGLPTTNAAITHYATLSAMLAPNTSVGLHVNSPNGDFDAWTIGNYGGARTIATIDVYMKSHFGHRTIAGPPLQVDGSNDAFTRYLADRGLQTTGFAGTGIGYQAFLRTSASAAVLDRLVPVTSFNDSAIATRHGFSIVDGTITPPTLDSRMTARTADGYLPSLTRAVTTPSGFDPMRTLNVNDKAIQMGGIAHANSLDTSLSYGSEHNAAVDVSQQFIPTYAWDRQSHVPAS